MKLRDGAFTDVNKLIDICTTLPEQKNLQKALISGMYKLSKQDPMVIKVNDKAAVTMLDGLGLDVDFKFKGKPLYKVAEQIGLNGVFAAVSSKRLKDKANNVSNSTNDNVFIPSINRSL